MNLKELKDFIKSSYPGNDPEYEFDKECHAFIEISLDEGEPCFLHNVVNNKVKVTIPNVGSAYFPIQPYRKDMSWDDVKELVNSF